MYLVSNSQVISPSPIRGTPPAASCDGDFFYQLFNNRFQYLDPAQYANGILVVPRFTNGDLLLLRLPRKAEEGFSVEFPFSAPHAQGNPHSGLLAGVAQAHLFDWSPRSVLRLGNVSSPKAARPLDVFLIAVPDEAVPHAYDSEGVGEPLRISDLEFKGMVARGDVHDGTSLAAYALLVTRQALQKAGVPLPLLDRRVPRPSPLKLARS